MCARTHTHTHTHTHTRVYINSFYAEQHWKKYSDCDELCANFIWDARMYPELNYEIYDEITYNIMSYA